MRTSLSKHELFHGESQRGQLKRSVPAQRGQRFAQAAFDVAVEMGDVGKAAHILNRVF
jgi:hypothetical protein